MRTETTLTASSIDAEGDGNGSGFDPKEMSENPDDQMNILGDGRAAGPAFTMDATPGYGEQPAAADVDMYDMGEGFDPSEWGEGEVGEEEEEYVRPRFYVIGGMVWSFGRIIDPE